MTLEICVDNALALDEAIAGGADRIELCSALELGGLTPTPGLMAQAGGATVPVYAMIRPRAGDFVFSSRDVETMLGDIDQARACGLAGVVLGASQPDGGLDISTLETLAAQAHGMGRTLHRAFDLVPDFAQALDQAIALGFERILTSGGQPTAMQGLDALKRIVSHADGRISIMPGAGITPANAATLMAELDIDELHSSGSVSHPAGPSMARTLGFQAATQKVTDRETIAAIKAAMSSSRTHEVLSD